MHGYRVWIFIGNERQSSDILYWFHTTIIGLLLKGVFRVAFQSLIVAFYKDNMIERVETKGRHDEMPFQKLSFS